MQPCVFIHACMSFNNEKNCREISEHKIAVCEKTGGLRSGNSSDLDSASFESVCVCLCLSVSASLPLYLSVSLCLCLFASLPLCISLIFRTSLRSSEIRCEVQKFISEFASRFVIKNLVGFVVVLGLITTFVYKPACEF